MSRPIGPRQGGMHAHRLGRTRLREIGSRERLRKVTTNRGSLDKMPGRGSFAQSAREFLFAPPHPRIFAPPKNSFFGGWQNILDK